MCIYWPQSSFVHIQENTATFEKSNPKCEITLTWIRHSVHFSVCVRCEAYCLIMAASVLYIQTHLSRGPRDNDPVTDREQAEGFNLQR